MISDVQLREYADAIRVDVTAPPLELVRRRARHRRRVQLAGAAAVVAGIAAAVTVPISLLSNESSGVDSSQVVFASPTPQPTRPLRYPLPPVGAPGFPASIYPAAHPGLVPAAVTTCPSSVDLQQPTSETRGQAIQVTRHLETRSFNADLRGTDRAWWPQVAEDWRRGYAHRQHANGGHILHTGLLSAPWPQLGVPDPKNWVRESCGAAVMRRSYVVTGGPTSDPRQSRALQGVQVFVVRAGRPLLYFEYP